MRWITALTLLASITHAGRTDDAEYRRRAAALKPQDARAHFVMALWCEKKDMKTNAWKHHAIVLEINARHRASRRALDRLRPDAKLLAHDALGAPTQRMRSDAVRALKRTRRPVQWILPALRHRSETTRTRAIRALGGLDSDGAIAPLVRHLASAGGNTTGAYMASGSQSAYVRDFDVEVA